MSKLALALFLFAAPALAAEECMKVAMKPGRNARAYQNLRVGKDCTAKQVFTCDGGVLLLSETKAIGDNRMVGAECYKAGAPELAARQTERQTLKPQTLGQATPGSDGQNPAASRKPAAMDPKKLRDAAIAKGVPAVIYDRALANFEKMKREGKTTRDCFMAADMTTGGYQGKLWQICSQPELKITEMPTNFGSGAGESCVQHVYKNTQSECAKWFGDRANYCLTAGGNYVTEAVTQDAGSLRPFVELKGLDADNDNAGQRRVGIHQTTFHSGKSYIGQTDRSRYSNGCITIPGSGTTVDPVSLSSQGDQGGMALYVYPAKQDIVDFREKGKAPYWNEACAKYIGKPGWVSSSNGAAPTEEEVHQQNLMETLKMQPVNGRD